jgi:hypothetical protein
MILLITVVMILLFAAWNGFVLNWALSKGEKRKRNNRIWHTIGAVVRILVVLIPILFYLPYWDLSVVTLFVTIPVSHAGYNTVINLIRKDKWYYLSEVGIDKYIKKYYKDLAVIEIFIFIFGMIAFLTT